MSNLRNKIIRLAYENPGEVREKLLPLLKQSRLMGVSDEEDLWVLEALHDHGGWMTQAMIWSELLDRGYHDLRGVAEIPFSLERLSQGRLAVYRGGQAKITPRGERVLLQNRPHLRA